IFSQSRIKKITLNTFFGLNILLMALCCIKPASDSEGLYNYLYGHYNGKSAILICKENDPFINISLYNYYSRPRDMVIFSNQNDPEMDSLIHFRHVHPILVLFIHLNDADLFAKLHPAAKMVYCNIPRQALKYNYFNWVTRTKFWMLYEVKE